MRMPDGTILMHEHAPYDPVKAHEYYMRTRKLHPRQKLAVQPARKGRRPHGTTYSVPSESGGYVKLSAQEYAKQSAYAHQRVVRIQARLAKLKTELHKKIAEAKVAARKANQPKTAAEKAQARRDAKKYRQSHKQELRNKAKNQADKQKNSGGSSTSTQKSDTVASLKADIIVARDNLKSAIARQRDLAAAKKNG